MDTILALAFYFRPSSVRHCSKEGGPLRHLFKAGYQLYPPKNKSIPIVKQRTDDNVLEEKIDTRECERALRQSKLGGRVYLHLQKKRSVFMSWFMNYVHLFRSWFDILVMLGVHDL
jgi:hypothetical protein